MVNINDLLQVAADRWASDLHVVCNLKPLIRVDGKLISLDNFEVINDEALMNVVKTMLNADQRTRLDQEKDLDLGYSVNNTRFRVNFSFERDHYRMVARVVRQQPPSLDEIGIPKVIYKLLGHQQGLILVTGPTGSGKSTTLAAMINYLNDNFAHNIITFEDPIEYLFTSNKSIITQRQLGFDLTSFSAGLKHVVRQDPNVIMVGELRDLETIAAAITLAETGHLVLATLHTFNAAQTIDRIIDVFPPYQQAQIRSQLTTVLSAVISQKLLPKVGGGRIVAREIMIRNAAIANLIREQKIQQIKNVIETGYSEGMITMSRHIRELYEQNLIDQETAEGQLEQLATL
ncbi:MAG TPA: PilT/PilU family type 4a pilus ATPase [bacterium]|nr:PilT/PilU family type 4a pilus ATPase [bacterium]HPT29412.1 PilT/PilU family type 4a pilus ATPase [bacterium]